MGCTAFLIAAHHEPWVFHRLVDRLSPYGAVIAHIDRDSDGSPFYRTDINFTRRLSVVWGGYSQVRAMRILLRAGLNDTDADHFCFLSGQDYPARSVDQFVEYVASGVGRSRSLIALQDLRSPSAQFRQLPYEWESLDLKRHHPGIYRALKRLACLAPGNRPPKGVVMWRGSTSWCLNRDIAQRCVDEWPRARGKAFEWYARTLLIPDEFYFATKAMNLTADPGCFLPPPIRNSPAAPFHYIDWDPAREDPAILDIGDLEMIRESGMFFVRKVAQGRSDELMDALDREG